ncbi:MAG TPA: ethanolamine ammonia-lyase subunit EutC [Acetobacteraceae bacterium]|nr:ethanolamine ammonia-lyase subunit EutC [Acetobacteraceae bacterium]
MAEPPDVWAAARALTSARIGLQRAGASLATGPLLEFRIAQARARDAVHAELDVARLSADLATISWAAPPLVISSAATDRQSYLLRPDLGRRLAPGTEARLPAAPCELVIVIADGLSAGAVQAHAAPVLAALVPVLCNRWRIGPLLIVRHGRVAIGDAIAMQLGAACALVLIGERPGLSAPDSMGADITWYPDGRAQTATTDADRNCISNIRPEGTPARAAAAHIAHLLERMRRSGVSGVALKDDGEPLLPEIG